MFLRDLWEQKLGSSGLPHIGVIHSLWEMGQKRFLEVLKRGMQEHLWRSGTPSPCLPLSLLLSLTVLSLSMVIWTWKAALRNCFILTWMYSVICFVWSPWVLNSSEIFRKCVFLFYILPLKVLLGKSSDMRGFPWGSIEVDYTLSSFIHECESIINDHILTCLLQKILRVEFLLISVLSQVVLLLSFWYIVL